MEVKKLVKNSTSVLEIDPKRLGFSIRNANLSYMFAQIVNEKIGNYAYFGNPL